MEGAAFRFVCVFTFQVDLKNAWAVSLNIDIGKITYISSIYEINILILVVLGPCQAGILSPLPVGGLTTFWHGK